MNRTISGFCEVNFKKQVKGYMLLNHGTVIGSTTGVSTWVPELWPRKDIVEGRIKLDWAAYGWITDFEIVEIYEGDPVPDYHVKMGVWE